MSSAKLLAIAASILALLFVQQATGQSTEYITCYSNNCTTLYGNITTCAVTPPSIYYPMPTCTVAASTGICYTLDWPVTSTRIFGCLTQRSCPLGYTCCSSPNRCNCDPTFSTVLCPQNLTALQIYPINAAQPFVVNADYIKTYRNYVFEVWTNVTQPGVNITFIIASVTTTATVAGNVSTLFGITPGSFINSAKIFIEAGTNLESYLSSASTAMTYTITILARSPASVYEVSQKFTVQITPYANHPPVLLSPATNPYQIYVDEDSESAKKIVTVCATDQDSNLDIWSMCESMVYEDFYTFNDPSNNFHADYNSSSCANVTQSMSTVSKAKFCIDIYSREGARFSVRDQAASYQLQFTFRDLWKPPAYLHVFFNVTVIPREDSFWRYCFVCNQTTCPEAGVPPTQRCLPGQHYCCKRILYQGSRLYYQADRFCSSIKADSEMAEISCCAHDYCNNAKIISTNSLFAPILILLTIYLMNAF